jgi:hypothetical protein
MPSTSILSAGIISDSVSAIILGVDGTRTEQVFAKSGKSDIHDMKTLLARSTLGEVLYNHIQECHSSAIQVPQHAGVSTVIQQDHCACTISSCARC